MGRYLADTAEGPNIIKISYILRGDLPVFSLLQPGRSGSVLKSELNDIPAYNTVAEALAAGGKFNVAVVYVPPAGAKDAVEARGVNLGLTISTPVEEFDNPYVTRELGVHFHYFFMRKFWFAYLAKAVIVFPGGFGTLDELFEILTLLQTHKIRKHLPVVVFGTDYWDQVIDFDALIRKGMIDSDDVAIFHRTDSVDDAFRFVTGSLAPYALDERGAIL